MGGNQGHVTDGRGGATVLHGTAGAAEAAKGGMPCYSLASDDILLGVVQIGTTGVANYPDQTQDDCAAGGWDYEGLLEPLLALLRNQQCRRPWRQSCQRGVS